MKSKVRLLKNNEVVWEFEFISRMIAEEFFGNELMKLGKTKMLDYSHGAHGRVALYEGNMELHLKEEY